MPNYQFRHKVTELSPYLFWDTDRFSINIDKSEKLIIERVLEYGQLEDWNILKQLYHQDEIIKVCLNSPSLDKVTVSFLCRVYNLKKEDFRCYKNTLSTGDFWNS